MSQARKKRPKRKNAPRCKVSRRRTPRAQRASQYAYDPELAGARRKRRTKRPAACKRKQRRNPRRPVAQPTPAPPAPRPGRSMSVTAREWSLTTSRAVLAAGSQTIELRNWGEDPHNLVISPDDGSHSPLVGWEEQDPGTYLAKDTGLGPGRYLLWCSLAGHEAAGMATTVRVE